MVNEVAKVGRRVMCEMADVPDDGAAMCLWASSQSEEDESSTIWLHKWFRQWIAHSFLDVMHFDQGAFGHSLRRPTTMATNLDVVELRGAQDRRTEWPTKGVCWASWAPMMVRVLVQGMKRWKQRPGWYTRMVRALKGGGPQGLGKTPGKRSSTTPCRLLAVHPQFHRTAPPEMFASGLLCAERGHSGTGSGRRT